jgi:L-fuculose-phosphate aldolase
MTDDEAKRKLIDAALVIDRAGLGDFTRGHVSVRAPGDAGLFHMKPHSFGMDEVTMENIVTCDLSGTKVAGGGRRHSEVFIHSEIYKVRPDVGAVLHAHPKYAVAFSTTGHALRPLTQPGAEFIDGVGVYDATVDLIRTPEMGADVARALGPYKAAFLQSHGVVVVGKTLEECVILSITLENACETQLLVEATGATPKEFPRAEIKKLADKMSVPEIYAVNFDYLVRKARR